MHFILLQKVKRNEKIYKVKPTKPTFQIAMFSVVHSLSCLSQVKKKSVNKRLDEMEVK